MSTTHCNYVTHTCVENSTGREDLKTRAFTKGGGNGSFPHLVLCGGVLKILWHYSGEYDLWEKRKTK